MGTLHRVREARRADAWLIHRDGSRTCVCQAEESSNSIPFEDWSPGDSWVRGAQGRVGARYPARRAGPLRGARYDSAAGPLSPAARRAHSRQGRRVRTLFRADDGVGAATVAVLTVKRQHVSTVNPISSKRHRFLSDVIRYAVWLHFRFTLSIRDSRSCSPSGA